MFRDSATFRCSRQPCLSPVFHILPAGVYEVQICSLCLWFWQMPLVEMPTHTTLWWKSDKKAARAGFVTFCLMPTLSE